MERKSRVVSLPTKDSTNIVYNNNDSTFYYYPTEQIIDKHISTCHHLYILSDDEIKDGDWYYLEKQGSIGSPTGVYQSRGTTISKLNTLAANCKKIVATTDKSLYTYSCSFDDCQKANTCLYSRSCSRGLYKEYLCSIPQSVIEEYCKNPN